MIDFDDRALRQYQLGDESGKRREGHAAGAKENKLMAYAAAGTSSCHESVNLEEALEKLRLGMAVMIREGYVMREMEALSGIAQKAVDLTNVMMVTDIADPAELVTRGGMNLLLKGAVGLGFDPVKAVQLVTINPARYFGLHELGGVESACHRLGSNIPRPFLTFQTFCFTGLPLLRLTDRGLVDVRQMKHVPEIA